MDADNNYLGNGSINIKGKKIYSWKLSEEVKYYELEIIVTDFNDNVVFHNEITTTTYFSDGLDGFYWMNVQMLDFENTEYVNVATADIYDTFEKVIVYNKIDGRIFIAPAKNEVEAKEIMESVNLTKSDN